MKKVIIAAAVVGTFVGAAPAVEMATLKALQDEITNRTEAVKLVDARVDTEQSARISSDTTLSNAVKSNSDSLSAAVTDLNTRIEQEVTDRTTADSLLSSRLSTETTNRANADTLLNDRLNEVDINITSKVSEKFVSYAEDTSSWVESTGVIPWTDHPVKVTLAEGAELSCSISASSKPVFCYVVPAGSYTKASDVNLVGYGSWPTSPFQCVVWCLNSKYYVNILTVETAE